MVLDAQDSYFNAVYNDYQQGVQDMKEFNKNYGDFLTQITKDQDWWNKNVTDKVHGFIADAYSRGIDLLRTPEGRAAVTQIINSMPYGEMAKKRVRAENAKEYYKAAGALAAQNKYSKDFAEYLGEDPNQWADDYMGTTSPTQFQTLKEATNDWYNNRTPRSATDKEKKELGLDRRYDWKMFNDEDLMNIARDQTPGWQNSPQARYYRDIAKKQLQAEGNIEPSSKEIEARLQRNIASAQQEWLVKPIKGDADQFALDDYRTANDIRADREKQATNYYYSILPYADTDGDGKLSQQEKAEYAKAKQASLSGKGGRGSNKEGRNYMMEQFDRGVQHFITGDAGNIPDANQIAWNASHIAKAAFDDTQMLRESKTDDEWMKNKDVYMKKKTARGLIDPSVLANSSGREKDNRHNNAVFLNEGDIDRLYDDKDIVSHTIGGGRNVSGGKRVRYSTDNSELKKESGKGTLKMEFTDETYTAPITEGDSARVQQYQKVKVYKHVKDGTDEYVGEKWFRIQRGSAHASYRNTKNQRVFGKIDNSWDDNDSGETQAMSTAVEKYLGASQSTYDNSQTRLD